MGRRWCCRSAAARRRWRSSQVTRRPTAFDVVDSAGERSSPFRWWHQGIWWSRPWATRWHQGRATRTSPQRPTCPHGGRTAPGHRSVNAGPAVAANASKTPIRTPRSRSSSWRAQAAAVVDSPEVPGVDDPTTGGVLDSYIGQEPSPGSLRPSQMSQLRDLLGLRPVNALMVSVGRQRAQFSDVVKLCIATAHCDRSNVRTEFEARAATLPGRYARLGSAINDLGVTRRRFTSPSTSIPPATNSAVVEMRCAVLGGLFDLLDDDEAPMGSHRRDRSAQRCRVDGQRHVWLEVRGGIASAFARHGILLDGSLGGGDRRVAADAGQHRWGVPPERRRPRSVRTGALRIAARCAPAAGPRRRRDGGGGRSAR